MTITVYGNVSPDPCSEFFVGPEAFSEIENQNIRDYFLAIDPVPELAVTFHSSEEVILTPYSWAYDTYPPNIEEHVSGVDKKLLLEV